MYDQVKPAIDAVNDIRDAIIYSRLSLRQSGLGLLPRPLETYILVEALYEELCDPDLTLHLPADVIFEIARFLGVCVSSDDSWRVVCEEMRAKARSVVEQPEPAFLSHRPLYEVARRLVEAEGLAKRRK